MLLLAVDHGYYDLIDLNKDGEYPLLKLDLYPIMIFSCHGNLVRRFLVSECLQAILHLLECPQRLLLMMSVILNDVTVGLNLFSIEYDDLRSRTLLHDYRTRFNLSSLQLAIFRVSLKPLGEVVLDENDGFLVARDGVSETREVKLIKLFHKVENLCQRIHFGLFQRFL